MSSYEDYATTSQHYDGHRAPVGLGLILERIAAVADLGAAQVLDAGCGTGNYLAALRPKVPNVQGLDASAGMLAKAQAKLPGLRLTQGSITGMPFETDSFDAVVMNQVVHHLDVDGAGTGYPVVRGALAEVARVLRPGGVFLLNTSSEQQIRRCYWFMDLIPAAVDRFMPRVPSPEWLVEQLQNLGFARAEEVPILGELLCPDTYLQLDGPLDPTWRAADSTWALATDEELEAALDRLRRGLEDGSAQELLDRSEATRAQLGQTLTVVGTR